MVKELSIRLNQYSGNSTYIPGSAITGSLIIVVNQPKKYKQITVFLKGSGIVSWSVGRRRRRRTYRATETYANEGFILWKKENSPNGTFPSGRHVIPFQLTLPPNCPSTYYSAVGNIGYMIEGVISTGTFKFDHKVQRPIKVLELVSANSSHWQQPSQIERRKIVRNWLCMSRQITYNIGIQRTGFNVGEEIPLSYYVENGSGRRITVKCQLLETVDFYASGGHKRLINCAVTSHSDPIRAHTTSGQQSVRLPIPIDLRPAMTHSNIIRSKYTVNVTLVIPWSQNATTVFPTLIGNPSGRQLNVRT